MRCVTRRAMMSVEPPGANGTITRMALLGYLSAACATEAPNVPAAPVATAMATARERTLFIDVFPPRLRARV
ncbi:hypothetical protein D3C72_2150270 [compost metagenome]